MKTGIKVLFLSSIALLGVSCSLQKKTTSPAQKVEHLSDSSRLAEGSAVYALPMTVFTINIGMTHQIEIPGPYSKYAGDLLGLNDVILAKTEKWTINSITVNSHEEADPSEFYVIEASGILRTNLLSLKSEGFILDLNPESGYTDPDLSAHREININEFRSYDLGSDEYYLTQTDTAYRRISINNQFIRVPYTVDKKKKLTTDELAERAAKRLLELRDGKILILTGEANVFPQSNAPIDELNRLEKEYTELFTGKYLTEERTFRFHYIPGREQNGKPVTLFKFSESKGVTAESDEAGMSVSIQIIPEQKTKDLTFISKQQPQPSETRFDKLYYRIPDIVNIRILIGTEAVYNSRKLVYQFGEVMQLPANYLISK